MPDPTGIDPELVYVTGVAHRLALSLATLVVDQTLLSESDVPFEPFTAAFPVDRRLTANSFREALGLESSRRWRSARRRGSSNGWRRSHWKVATSGTASVRHARVGDGTCARHAPPGLVRGDDVVEVPFFLFGRLSGGPLVGLRSLAIET